jgi:quercetin dioxygenase-like cupin family protein
MVKNTLVRFGMVAASVGAAFVAGTAFGQQAAPTQSKGVRSEPVNLDLGTIVDPIPGRQLRLTYFTVEPGGVLGLHNHANSPGLARILQGAMTIHAEGVATKEYKAGETFSVGKDDTHWEENRGTIPLTFVFAAITKRPPQ